MKKHLGICLLVLAFGFPARAQYYGTELPFVIGNGARSSTIGVAGAGFFPDASIQYRNPSALGFIERKEILFFRTVLFDSRSSYHALSYVHPLLDYGSFGMSLMRLDVGGIEERNESNQLLSDDMRLSQTRLLMGYARSITSSIAAGFNLKIDHQAVGSFSSSGVGLDVGMTASQNVRLGSYVQSVKEALVIENLIEPSVKLDVEKVSDPMRFSIGVSALSSIGGVNIVTSLDLVSPRYSPFTLRLIQEMSYRGLYALRFSIDRESPSMGFGARFRGVGLDYSYTGQELGGNHRFSLSYGFGSSLDQMRRERRAALETAVDEKISERLSELESRQLEKALAEADSLFDAGEYGAALPHYEGVLLLDPGNEHAEERIRDSRYAELVSQGRRAFDAGDFGRSLFYFRQSFEVMPGDSASSAMAALCEKLIDESRNRDQQVERLLREAIDLYAERDYQRALAGFDEVIKLDPDNKLASEYREKCILNIEGEVSRLLARAGGLERAGDISGALEALDRAMTYRKNDPVLMERRARLQMELASRARARRAASASKPPERPAKKRTAVDSKILEKSYSRGMKAFNEGDFDTAIKNFLEVWTADPSFHNVTSFLTRAYLYMGMRKYSEEDYVAAMDIWKKVLTIDPQNEKAKRYLAKTSKEYERLSGNDHAR